MVRPGFGLKEAPRLWNLRLKQVMTKLQLLSLVRDPQFYCKWAGSRRKPVPRELVPTNVDEDKARGTDVLFADPQVAMEDLQMVCSTHVDDPKGSSTESVADAFIHGCSRVGVRKAHEAKEKVRALRRCSRST
eukprot:8465934-Pyramimonas_sp.AAC.1